MTTNKFVIYLSLIFCIGIIAIPTITKVINKNHAALNKVNEKMAIESAEKCIFEGRCKSGKIYLKDLYDMGYLEDDIVSPETKVIYSKESYVVIEKENAIFYPVG